MGKAIDTRNFVIAGHTGSGKTLLCEQILLQSGAIARAGTIEGKNTVSDFMNDEHERGSSIYASLCSCKWNDLSLYFVDTPGYSEFFGQTLGAIRACDAALVVVDAIDGPQIGTARAWKAARERGIARFGFVNRLDKERADFDATLEQMRKNHGRNVIIPLYWPVGKEEGFERVVSVLYDKDIPADIADQVAECRQLWLDAIAETDDEIMMRVLDGGEITEDEIRVGVRKTIMAGKTIPVFPGSAVKGIGVPELLDAIKELFPNPFEYATVDGADLEVKEDGPALGVVFMSLNDPFTGQLTFVRAISGNFTGDLDIYNRSTGAKERFGSMFVMNGKTQTALPAAAPGTLFAVAKLKDSHIGDTMSSDPDSRVLPGVEPPNPIMFYAVTAAKSGEDEKIVAGITKIIEAMPSVKLERNNETHELLLCGMGDQQLGIVSRRLKEQFKVEAVLSTPKVPYRETITGSGEGHYRHKKQSGGAGQFAEVFMRISNSPEGYKCTNDVVGGAIPKNFIPAIEKGVQDMLEEGPLVGCRVENVAVSIFDGKYHPVDSNEMAFRIAGRQAFKEAMSQAGPVILEPIMAISVHVPSSYTGDINGDLNHKRGRILGMESEEGIEIIKAEVPMAELHKYATELRSMTQGRGTFEMEFARYEQVPPNVAQEIIAKHQAEKGEE